MPVFIDQANNVSSSQISDDIIVYFETNIKNIVGDAEIIAMNTAISIMDALAPDFLLPAIMVSIIEDRSLLPAQEARQKENTADHETVFVGDQISVVLKSDPIAVLGYKAIYIGGNTMSLITDALVQKVSATSQEGFFIFDDMILQFKNWLRTHNLNSDAINNIADRIGVKNDCEAI